MKQLLSTFAMGYTIFFMIPAFIFAGFTHYYSSGRFYSMPDNVVLIGCLVFSIVSLYIIGELIDTKVFKQAIIYLIIACLIGLVVAFIIMPFFSLLIATFIYITVFYIFSILMLYLSVLIVS